MRVGRAGLVALVACALLSGCTKVMFMGDSITATAKPTLQDKAQKAYMISDVVATPNITTEQLLADARATDLRDTDAVVINIGTNDVGQDRTDWQTYYDQLLALVNAKSCVVVTTVNHFAEYIDPPIVVHTDDINAYLRTQVAAHTNYRLVDWDTEVANSTESLTVDGIHPNAKGAAWLGDADVAAVQSCAS